MWVTAPAGGGVVRGGGGGAHWEDRCPSQTRTDTGSEGDADEGGAESHGAKKL